MSLEGVWNEQERWRKQEMKIGSGVDTDQEKETGWEIIVEEINKNQIWSWLLLTKDPAFWRTEVLITDF